MAARSLWQNLSSCCRNWAEMGDRRLGVPQGMLNRVGPELVFGPVVEIRCIEIILSCYPNQRKQHVSPRISKRGTLSSNSAACQMRKRVFSRVCEIRRKHLRCAPTRSPGLFPPEAAYTKPAPGHKIFPLSAARSRHRSTEPGLGH